MEANIHNTSTPGKTKSIARIGGVAVSTVMTALVFVALVLVSMSRNYSLGSMSIDNKVKRESAAPASPMLPSECKPFLSWDGERTLINMAAGTFIPSDTPPAYDHVSCFAMKARYNCAGSKHNASDYKWVLGPQEKNCDIRSVVATNHGPLGLANILRHRHDVSKNRPINIVLQGNSFLRQVWESISCQWHQDITGGLLQDGGPVFNLETMQKRGFRGKKVTFKSQFFTASETGHILPFDKNTRGCHGVTSRDELNEYYRENVPVPDELFSETCNDDLAMVELGGQLRFWFVFHPHLYDTNVLDV